MASNSFCIYHPYGYNITNDDNIAATAKDVADALGNTAAVCRKSYINPIVFTAWRSRLIEKIVPRTRQAPRRLEALTLKVLKQAKRSTGH